MYVIVLLLAQGTSRKSIRKRKVEYYINNKRDIVIK